MPAALPYWRLSGFYFFYFAFIGAFAPYWSLYLKAIDYSAFQIGLLMSLLQVMRMFAPNLWGWLADRSGRRVLIVQLAALLSLVAYGGVFFGTGFGWMLAVMAAMSFFWSASLPLVEATTLMHLGESTARYGRIRLWGSIGFIVAVIGVGYALDFVAITALLWMVLGCKLGIVFFARQIPDAELARHEGDGETVARILARPEVLAFFAACFLMAAAHGPYYIFYSLYLVEHGYSKGAIGWLWAVGVICEVGVFFVMPRLMARFSLRQILAFSFGCAVARFLLIGWAAELLSLLALAQLMHAATFGAYHAAAVAVVHRLFRGRHHARGQALYTSLSFGAGGSLGGFLAGAGWEALGPGLTFSVAAAAALAGLALIAWKLRLE